MIPREKSVYLLKTIWSASQRENPPSIVSCPAHIGTMVMANKIAAADTAATTWLRVSDVQNYPLEINSAPTRTIPRYPLKIGPKSNDGL
jgi:hypothetical protein